MPLLAEAGFRRELALFGLTFRTGDGRQFKALKNSKGSLDFQSLMSGDVRGSDCMEILKSGAPDFETQQTITETKSGDKYIVTKPMFDGPDYTLRYELERRYDGKK
jgi:hypothetical protein